MPGASYLVKNQIEHLLKTRKKLDEIRLTESTYLDSHDLFLLALVFKQELGIKTYDPCEDGMDNKLYIAQSMASIDQEMQADELLTLTNKNSEFKKYLNTTLEAVWSALHNEREIQRRSLLIIPRCIDEKETNRCININIVWDASGPSIHIFDNLASLANKQQQDNYGWRLRKLLYNLLDDQYKFCMFAFNSVGASIGADLMLRSADKAVTANCGIYALINKIQYEFYYKDKLEYQQARDRKDYSLFILSCISNPEEFIKPLRAALNQAYLSGKVDELSKMLRPWVRQRIQARNDNTEKLDAIPYKDIYERQEKNRRWKTALAIFVGIITLPTIILPILSYFLWQYAKNNELMHKIEMSPNEYAALKKIRQTLAPPRLVYENKKPKKVIITADKNPNKKAMFYMDKYQASRLRFFAAHSKEKPLSNEDRAWLCASKVNSLAIA